MLNNQMYLKLLQKEQLKKKATGDLIGNKNANKITKNHPKILQRWLIVKQKYQQKDIYLQKKDRKLLMN